MDCVKADLGAFPPEIQSVCSKQRCVVLYFEVLKEYLIWVVVVHCLTA